MNPVIVEFKNYKDSLNEAMKQLDAKKRIADEKKILIKPNLVLNSPPPVTTDVKLCAEIVSWIRLHTDSEIIIAEGTGAADYDTDHVFNTLGYRKLSEEMDVELVDLNKAETCILKNSRCKIFPQFHLPKILLEYYMISVPVLKAHSLADMTGTMKNMMGCAPPEHYQAGGMWKKSVFHRNMQESIIDLNRYISADLTIMDAVIGLADYHLGGARCNPPINKLIAGFNPILVDRKGAEFLGFDWKKITHIAIESLNN